MAKFYKLTGLYIVCNRGRLVCLCLQAFSNTSSGMSKINIFDGVDRLVIKLNLFTSLMTGYRELHSKSITNENQPRGYKT